MRLSTLLLALGLTFVCTNVHADELVYNYTESSSYGIIPLTDEVLPTDNVVWIIYGTAADNPYPDEWLEDLTEVYEILGIEIPTSGPYLYTAGIIRGCNSAELEVCDISKETIWSPTTLPVGIHATGSIMGYRCHSRA
jgi:hypothetical protein